MRVVAITDGVTNSTSTENNNDPAAEDSAVVHRESIALRNAILAPATSTATIQQAPAIEQPAPQRLTPVIAAAPAQAIASTLAQPAAHYQSPAPAAAEPDLVQETIPAGEDLLTSSPTIMHDDLLACDQDDCPYGLGQSGTRYICGVDCGLPGAPCCATWENSRYIPWSMFGPGEYVGPARTEHVPNYYLRVNDLLTLTYISSRQKMSDRYQLGIGDQLRIESSVDTTLDRTVTVQPDGEITLPIVGEVLAAGKTIRELREDLEVTFREAQRNPQITVTPVEINSGLTEIIRAVKAEIGSNGQALNLKVTPEGTIQVPGIGSVYVQGLTLEELRSELEARYAAQFGPGLMISPALSERATTYVFVGGQVITPGRYTLEGPTTVMQAITLAGGWVNGGNLRQVVIFRRDENWCLRATKIDIHRPYYGKDPCPVNDIWLRDNDLVIVPKTPILCATDLINLYFTRGVYAVLPVTYFVDLSTGTTIIP